MACKQSIPAIISCNPSRGEGTCAFVRSPPRSQWAQASY
jgi:hypothetical protein